MYYGSVSTTGDEMKIRNGVSWRVMNACVGYKNRKVIYKTNLINILREIYGFLILVLLLALILGTIFWVFKLPILWSSILIFLFESPVITGMVIYSRYKITRIQETHQRHSTELYRKMDEFFRLSMINIYQHEIGLGYQKAVKMHGPLMGTFEKIPEKFEWVVSHINTGKKYQELSKILNDIKDIENKHNQKVIQLENKLDKFIDNEFSKIHSDFKSNLEFRDGYKGILRDFFWSHLFFISDNRKYEISSSSERNYNSGDIKYSYIDKNEEKKEINGLYLEQFREENPNLFTEIDKNKSIEKIFKSIIEKRQEYVLAFDEFKTKISVEKDRIRTEQDMGGHCIICK